MHRAPDLLRQRQHLPSSRVTRDTLIARFHVSPFGGVGSLAGGTGFLARMSSRHCSSSWNSLLVLYVRLDIIDGIRRVAFAEIEDQHECDAVLVVDHVGGVRRLEDLHAAHGDGGLKNQI